MTLAQVGGLVSFALMLAAGQALFKTTALSIAREVTLWASLLTLFLTASFWLAIALYGGATLLWIYLLQSVPLSRAYPFAALGFVIVPLLAIVFFGERVNAMYVAGIVLIVSGIIITARA